MRKEVGVLPDDLLIGLIARFDPLKDHRTFTEAARLTLIKMPNTHFLLCGRNITQENRTLKAWINETGATSNFHLLGFRDDIPNIMNGLDINSLSSTGEAFPNVIGEAMACAVPCVATNVRDVGDLIGDTGIVVPAKDPEALAQGWERLAQMKKEERLNLGQRARMRIQQVFDITLITRRYESLYEESVGEQN